MRTIAACLFFVLIVAVPTPADEPFVELPFADAQARADKESKLVFIDFFTTWCAPCKIMDKTTFKDEKVITWLKENTVALKLDAEKEVKLAEKYRIDGHPTLLFLKPDGVEAGRLIGLHTTEEFLPEATAIRSGKSPLERAMEKLEAAGKDDPMARQHFASSLVQMGKYEEALTEYLWCFDEGMKQNLAYAGVRLSFLLSDIARLGAAYPPALEAMRKRRDAARERIVSEAPQDASSRLTFDIQKLMDRPVLDYVALNRELGEKEKSLALYDQMRAEHPGWPVTEELRSQVEDQLRAAHRYAEIADKTDIEKEVDDAIRLEAETKAGFPEEERDEFAAMDRQFLIQDIADYYEVLIGIGKHDAADRVARKALEVYDGPETYNALAWAGYLTDHPTDANLAQARKAYDLTDGKDAAIVDTLVRVLGKLDQQEEACKILQRATADHPEGAAHEVIAQCVTDLGCTPKG